MALALGSAQPLLAQQTPDQPVVPSQEHGSERLATEPTLDLGLKLLAARNYQQAAETLADVVVKKQASIRLLEGRIDQAAQAARETQALYQALIGAGTALRQLGRNGEAVEFFESAIQLSGSHREMVLTTPKHLATIELATAECAASAGNHQKAIEYCRSIIQQVESGTEENVLFEEASQLPVLAAARQTWIRSALALKRTQEAWDQFLLATDLESVDKRDWQELAIAIGLAALSNNEPAIAQIALRWYLKHAVELGPDRPVDRETAILGIAWAAAQGAEPYEVAAQRLMDFVEEFPSSVQAPKALLVGAGCFQRCDKSNEAVVAYEKLIQQYPESIHASAAAGQLLALRPNLQLDDNLSQHVRRLLAETTTIPLSLIEAAAVLAAKESDQNLWRKLIGSIEAQPKCGSQVRNILKALDDCDHAGDAELLVTQILSSEKIIASVSGDHNAEDCPVDQACRWAAARGQWHLLSIAGRELRQSGAYKLLGPLSLRLLAEGAMQSSELTTARDLLDHLIVKQQNQDFDTLLRRAEIAVSLEAKDIAGEAIDRAERQAKSKVDFALASVLRAQWFIRDARMLDARDTLERVLRNVEVSDAVKARARWLLGETYYLQRQFAEAVNHYRLVEPLDASGQWTALALVQAGRCFEELGRTRDAAICYTGLITRFGNSPHLPIAQQRLAALNSTDPNGGPNDAQNRKTQLR